MKLNLKVISLLLILFFISVSAANAQPNDTAIKMETNADEIPNINSLTIGFEGFYELQSQIWNATAGDTINLTSDYIYDGQTDFISINQTITLDGRGHTLNGNNHAIFNVSSATCNVVIKNAIFINGEGSLGSAIFADYQSDYLTIDNCTFKDNKAISGGAVYIKSNYSTITNCLFENNAASYGGAVRIDGNSSTLKNNKFTNNEAINETLGATYTEGKSSAGSNGGAAYISGASATITNNRFKNNTAGKLAGALFIKSNNTIIKNNEFRQNTAKRNGGAIYLEGQNSKLKNNRFTSNHAGKLGGAIRFDGSSNTTELTDNAFKSNDAQSGGAIYAEGTKITLSKNTFDNNKATNGSGGTLDIYYTTATVSDNTITNSNAKRSGGAIYIESENLKLTNNNISNCIAEEVGGAAYIKGTSALDILENKFANNTAGKVAGAIFIKSNNATIKNNEFMKNTASASGGAIRIEGDFHIISNNTFTENKGIDTLGGAICSLGHNNQFTYNTFINNIAGRDGGALFTEGTNVAETGHNNTVSNNVFIGNIVSGNPEGCHGGAISMAGEDCAINHNNFIGNHGSIRIGGNNSVISGNNMTNSKATTGGTIYVNGENTQLKNNLIKKSSAERDAGAIYITGASATITENKFIDNTAGRLAGAALIKSDNADVHGNEFTGNTAETLGGGAIYAEGTAMTLSKNTFNNNNAAGVGGTINIKGASTTISDNKIEKSASKQVGGGIYAKGENIQIKSSALTECSSQGNGGGAYLEGSGTVSRCGFRSCSSTKNGGGIYFKNTNFNLVGNSFKSNTAQNGANYYPTDMPSTKLSTRLTATDVSTTYGSDRYITVTLKDTGGNPIGGESIGFENNGMKYIITDDDGKARYYINELAPGSYSIKVTFKGTDAYNPSDSVTSNVLISKAESIMTAKAITTSYDSGANITATLKDENGNAISDVEITFKIGSSTLTATTDKEGIAAVSTDGLTAKKYDANITFSGNDLYNAASKTAKVTINKANTTIDVQDVSTIHTDKNGALIATLINDRSGKAIRCVTVAVKINGEKYALKTDFNGQVKVSTANLALGDYTATITYAGNSKYNKASATVDVRVSKADIIISAAYDVSKKKIVATLTNNVTGSAIAHAHVKFNLNGMTTTVKTNSNGQATVLTTDVTSNIATAIISYAGNEKYNSASTSIDIALKTKVIITDIYGYSDKLVATLTNGATGKPIVNAYMQVEINGMTKTAKSNSKSQISINTSDLGLTAYDVTISYRGNTRYTPSSTTVAIDLNKANMNIIYSYNADTKELTATLKNSKTGKVVSNANMIIELNGVKTTYKSNNQGKITLPTADFAPGTYVGTVTYPGNARYNSISAVFKVDV